MIYTVAGGEGPQKNPPNLLGFWAFRETVFFSQIIAKLKVKKKANKCKMGALHMLQCQVQVPLTSGPWSAQSIPRFLLPKTTSFSRSLCDSSANRSQPHPGNHRYLQNLFDQDSKQNPECKWSQCAWRWPKTVDAVSHKVCIWRWMFCIFSLKWVAFWFKKEKKKHRFSRTAGGGLGGGGDKSEEVTFHISHLDLWLDQRLGEAKVSLLSKHRLLED